MPTTHSTTNSHLPSGPQTVPNASYVDNSQRIHNVKLGINVFALIAALNGIIDGFWVMIAYFKWYTLIGGLLRM